MPLWAARRQVRYRPRVSLRDPGVRQFLWLSLPLTTFAVTAEGFFGWAASFFMALTIAWRDENRLCALSRRKS